MAKSNEALEFPVIWAEHIHSARYFRGVTVLLGIVCFMLLWMLWSQVTEPDPEPLVVRVDAVGRAQVVDYDIDRATVDQTDPVVPYFLTEFMHSHFARRHGLGAEEWQRSHYFLTPELSQIAYTRDEQELVDFISSAGQAAEQVVEDVRIRIIPQPEPPYRAEVFFDRFVQVGKQFLERLPLGGAPGDGRYLRPVAPLFCFVDDNRQLHLGCPSGSVSGLL